MSDEHASEAGGRLQRLAGLNPFGASIFFVERTGSTMDEARALAVAGEPPGTVIATHFQASGRGRQGGAWHAAPGESLLFTIILELADHPTTSIAPHALAAGLALARFLERTFSLRPELKWPNDVLVGGRKIAGILCEAKGAIGFIGIGVNCNQVKFPVGLAREPTSIALETGRRGEPLELLRPLLQELRPALEDANWREEVTRRLHRRGEVVRVLAAVGPAGTIRPAARGRKEIAATLKGIGPRGELIVSVPGEKEELLITSGVLRYDG